MSRRGRSSPDEIGKYRAAKLKNIALSETSTFGERMRAIDLLGDLRDDAFDALVDVASKGLTYSERMNALDMMEKIVKHSKVRE